VDLAPFGANRLGRKRARGTLDRLCSGNTLESEPVLRRVTGRMHWDVSQRSALRPRQVVEQMCRHWCRYLVVSSQLVLMAIAHHQRTLPRHFN